MFLLPIVVNGDPSTFVDALALGEISCVQGLLPPVVQMLAVCSFPFVAGRTKRI